jgi:hypothetical protein
MAEEMRFKYEIVEANHLGGESYNGTLTKLSRKWAEVLLEKPVPILSNLKMQLLNSSGLEVPGTLYGKVLGAAPESSAGFSIRFTSVSPELETFLREPPESGVRTQATQTT